MRKKHNKARSRYGLQVITLCISTALVLILLGMIVLSVFTARNLTNYVKENLVVTMMLDQDLTNPEAQRLCTRLQARPYIKSLTFISKDQALKEQTVAMGSDPSEFVGGDNPFLASIELTLKGDYANNDSINWISKELKAYPKVADITYQHELVENVNSTLSKISLVLFHTMKLVGASWGFIRRPFIKQAIGVGIVAALLAILVLAGCIYGLYRYQDNMLSIITWDVIAITGCAVMLFGISITAICAYISVNRFLRMKAGELYKI